MTSEAKASDRRAMRRDSACQNRER